MLRTRRNLGHNYYGNDCRLTGARFGGEGGNVTICLLWIGWICGYLIYQARALGMESWSLTGARAH
jgi:hypothetical protein